jgi:hypothetical protein
MLRFGCRNDDGGCIAKVAREIAFKLANSMRDLPKLSNNLLKPLINLPRHYVSDIFFCQSGGVYI